MRPLQISPETAQKLAKQLNVPLEHLMHMPQHILLQKLAELASAKPDESQAKPDESAGKPEAE
ncbi:YycC family protein [Paenibacillus filicis]|uniref:YycC family protein n=1 Tax=Paenibacillus filicis TaxID=669464 RepID=A0ABU9DLG5_9BACL